MQCVVGGELVVAHLFLGLEPLVLYWRFAHSMATQTQVVARYKSHRLGLNEDLQGCTWRRFSLWIHTLSYIVTLILDGSHPRNEDRQFLCKANIYYHISKFPKMFTCGFTVLTVLPIMQFWSKHMIICFLFQKPELIEACLQWQACIVCCNNCKLTWQCIVSVT